MNDPPTIGVEMKQVMATMSPQVTGPAGSTEMFGFGRITMK